MKLFCKKKRLELTISDEILDFLVKNVLEHFPNEFGGFFVGHYSSDFLKLKIEGCLLPKIFKGSRFGFIRKMNGLEEIFKEMFNNTGQYYVGEWHSHPNGSLQYSLTDLKAMKSIVDCETVNITNPILLIIGIKNERAEFEFYYYDKGELIRYDKS